MVEISVRVRTRAVIEDLDLTLSGQCSIKELSDEDFMACVMFSERLESSPYGELMEFRHDVLSEYMKRDHLE